MLVTNAFFRTLLKHTAFIVNEGSCKILNEPPNERRTRSYCSLLRPFKMKKKKGNLIKLLAVRYGNEPWQNRGIQREWQLN